MQLDMHYYGTYAMARAAGLKLDVCRVIAYAAQYVDDNSLHNDTLFAKDKGHMNVTATAHHATDAGNLDDADQRLVWVPFHFLPGNEGESYDERLLCRKDSYIAAKMLEHHLDLLEKPFGIHLMGLSAHVYADTFSHYGFSGFSSELNQIDPELIEIDESTSAEMLDYVVGKFTRFIERIQSDAAQAISDGLGHGAVHTYPDRPYLRWSIKDGKGGVTHRDNQATFIEACEKLHELFVRVATVNAYRDKAPQPFSAIKEQVVEILAVEGDCSTRIKAWKDAAQSGVLFDSKESIPDYDKDLWTNELSDFQGLDNSADAIGTDSFKFLQAAEIHRAYVLRDLLPENGLLVR
jgi:hypothetical protein